MSAVRGLSLRETNCGACWTAPEAATPEGSHTLPPVNSQGSVCQACTQLHSDRPDRSDSSLTPLFNIGPTPVIRAPNVPLPLSRAQHPLDSRVDPAPLPTGFARGERAGSPGSEPYCQAVAPESRGVLRACLQDGSGAAATSQSAQADMSVPPGRLQDCSQLGTSRLAASSGAALRGDEPKCGREQSVCDSEADTAGPDQCLLWAITLMN
jgi:hypothetical protein